jgi:hypothetical protein
MVALGFVLGMASMMALGSLVAARVSRASTGTPIGNIIFFFPLLLTAGVFTVEPGTVLYQNRAGHPARGGHVRKVVRCEERAPQISAHRARNRRLGVRTSLMSGRPTAHRVVS